MSFLLDTNVVSEWVKPKPDFGVITWLAEVDEDHVFLSTATIAELRHGIERMSAGMRRERLDLWLTEQLPARFERRILPIDISVAVNWGKLMARSQSMGHSIGIMDGFLAATAELYGLTLVTRNTAHFRVIDHVLNPWSI